MIALDAHHHVVQSRRQQAKAHADAGGEGFAERAAVNHPLRRAEVPVLNVNGKPGMGKGLQGL